MVQLQLALLISTNMAVSLIDIQKSHIGTKIALVKTEEFKKEVLRFLEWNADREKPILHFLSISKITINLRQSIKQKIQIMPTIFRDFHKETESLFRLAKAQHEIGDYKSALENHYKLNLFGFNDSTSSDSVELL